MAAERRDMQSFSWRQWTLRVAPPVVTAAALFAGWPSVSPAQTGWKWFGSQPPTAQQPPRPQSGFASAIQRLMEQARQEAAAGDYHAALKTAERAHKIADAATGVLGRDPEFSPDVTRKFLNDMVALADASRGVPSAVVASKPKPSGPPIPSKNALAMSAPAAKPQAVVTQPLTVAQVIEAEPQAQSPVSSPVAAITPQAIVWSEDPADPPPPAPAVPELDTSSPSSMFAILGGEARNSTGPAINHAPLPDWTALEAAVIEPTQSATSTSRTVTWSSRDAAAGNWYDNAPSSVETAARTSPVTETPVALPATAAVSVAPHPVAAHPVAVKSPQDDLTFGMTFSLGEPVTSLGEPVMQQSVAVPTTTGKSPTTNLDDATFAALNAVDSGASTQLDSAADSSPYVVTLDVDALASELQSSAMASEFPQGESATQPVARPAAVSEPKAAPVSQVTAPANPTTVAKPEPTTVAKAEVVSFDVDQALLIGTAAKPSTAAQPPAVAPAARQTVQAAELVPAAATSRPSAREYENIVPTEWSSANPEHRVPKRKTARWVDPTWESAAPQPTEPGGDETAPSQDASSAAVEADKAAVVVAAQEESGTASDIVMATFVQQSPAAGDGQASQMEKIQAVRELKSALSEQTRKVSGEMPQGSTGMIRTGSVGNVDLMVVDFEGEFEQAARVEPSSSWLARAQAQRWLLGSGLALIGMGLFLFRSTSAGNKTI